MPRWLLHRIPDGVSTGEAAIMEPAAIAAQTLHRANVGTADFVVIFGPGPIGLISAQMAMIAGASRVIMVGKEIDSKIRLPLAKKLGVDHVINIDDGETNLENIVKNLTSGIMGQMLSLKPQGQNLPLIRLLIFYVGMVEWLLWDFQIK